jgi:hypothetical protein
MNNPTIEIKVIYKDAYGDSQIVKTEAEGFEKAEELLGKIERGIENEKRNIFVIKDNK